MVERDIRERYFRLLKGYVVSQDEKYLLEASELGGEMLLAGIPEEEVAETHEEATCRLAREFPEMTLQDAATSLSIPLIEVIMAYSLAFCSEIEERKRNEESLRESEEKYRRIFENIQDVYYEASMDGIILEISPSIENISKYKRKELIGKSLYDIYTDPKERDELISVILDKGKIDNFEVQLTDKDGSQHSVELNATLDRDQKGNPRKFIGSMRDISERKRLEARLLQSEKMEAIGTLAGGIAHEFNTLMTTIMGNADLALMSTGKDDPLREGLEDIKSAGKRAADLTRQIMAFSRKQMRQPKILDLNEVLVNSEKTLKRLITENVELKTIFEFSLRTVNMDPTQIEQMVVNLVTNAGDAMPTGGTLFIETANVDLDEDFFKDIAEKERPGSYVMLSVTDTGSGMDAKTQEHMFDPFYTTREVGKGTGLGLSMVYGIVRQNEGVIRVDSEIGRGSTFRFYLPMAKDDEGLKIDD
ncbi:MAG: PAS domain S-box protein [Deltaproteobacteria bacterium]|nr:PAS domain S-box protein [Deltaproteobacteria bacterium]